ncbi:helix-turn-helix transcriptional regulator [Sphingobacterium lactis]|uniref:helix-turn-helix transcriptional regulator n=1 Tax=Sphingobacterium lactis TaxID=797291 RepID=UPI003F7E537D
MNFQDKLMCHAQIVSLLTNKWATWEEIKNRIASKIDDSSTYNVRTFQRDVKTIAETFGIEIKYANQKNAYGIDNKSEAKANIEALVLLTSKINKVDLPSFVFKDDQDGLGAVHLEEIIFAIENQFSLSILYQKFQKNTSETRNLIPLALKENNKRWYLLAEDLDKGSLRIFGLDRMNFLKINFSKGKSKFHREEIFKLWNSSIGITLPERGKSTSEVILKVDSVLAPYLLSLPWHVSQKSKDEGERGILVEMNVLIDNYLINKILSCMPYVEVIKPNLLKEKIKEILTQSLKKNES